MPINSFSNKLYQKAVSEGGQILENGHVYRVLNTKDMKKVIQQTITPSGDYATQISQNGQITKIINRNGHGSSSYIDTWDYENSQGKNISTVVVNKESFLQKVFNKLTKDGVDANGKITHYVTGPQTSYDSVNIKLFGNTSFTKPGGVEWLNAAFIDKFWK